MPTASPAPAPAPSSAALPAAKPASERIASIDALRGFDMFWIVGGGSLVLAIAALFPEKATETLRAQMKHIDWVGFSAWDMIMPLFLFIVGAAMPFSFAKRFSQGSSMASVYRKILIRVLILWVLGMIAQGGLLKFDIKELRLFSNTLQSIAVGYLVSSIALLHLPILGQFLLATALLVGFWALMTFVPVPGQAAGLLEEKMNLARYVDEQVLGQFRSPASTYTWVLSGMGFAATTLMGVFAGHIVRMRKSGAARFALLLLAGCVCLALGWVWSHGLSLGQGAAAQAADAAPKSIWIFPLNKHLWSSSMALWAGGWSYLLLAAFYLVIDVWGFRAWAFPFVVLGANALFVYMVDHVWSGRRLAEPLVGGLAKFIDKWGEYFMSFPSISGLGVNLGKCGGVLTSFTGLAILWLILWYMYRNKTFIRA